MNDAMLKREGREEVGIWNGITSEIRVEVIGALEILECFSELDVGIFSALQIGFIKGFEIAGFPTRESIF